MSTRVPPDINMLLLPVIWHTIIIYTFHIHYISAFCVGEHQACGPGPLGAAGESADGCHYETPIPIHVGLVLSLSLSLSLS